MINIDANFEIFLKPTSEVNILMKLSYFHKRNIHVSQTR